MTFAQRRNRLTTHFSEGIPVVKRRISVCGKGTAIRLGPDMPLVLQDLQILKISRHSAYERG
jgi:hypothetical protein